MDNVWIIEAAQYMQYGIRFPDIGQKLIAKALAFAGPLHQAGNVYHLDGIGDQILRLYQFSQSVQTLVGNGDGAHVGLNGAERKIGRLSPCIRQAIEQGRFTDIGKTNDTALKGHGVIGLGRSVMTNRDELDKEYNVSGSDLSRNDPDRT